MLAMVLGVSTILFNEVKILGNMGNSTSAFYAAESGLEKTLYFDRKQVPAGAVRGLCNICNICTSSDCSSCTATSLATNGTNGCDVASCTNCRVTYNSTFGDMTYAIDARISPDPSTGISTLFINARGFYRDAVRTINTKLHY